MKVHGIPSSSLLTAAAILLFISSHPKATAERISLQSQSSVKSGCSGSGDAYWPKGGSTSTYGCMKADGSGIVCGGKGKTYANSCDTWTAAMKVHRRPTRGGLEQMERA